MNSLKNNLRSQHVKLLIRVFLLLAAVFVFCYSLLETDWIGTPIISLTLIALITSNIIFISEKSHRDFAQFLNNISHNDFSSSTALSTQTPGFKSFVDAQRLLLSKFKKLKTERSVQNEYLQMVVEHVDTALLCFDSNGKMEFINNAACKLLNKKFISSINIIRKLNPEIASALEKIHSGEHVVIKIVLDNELQSLILTASEFILLEKPYKLVSIQNIKNALDEGEIESWQKLIKVLTHEIMNSMTPIVSLSHYVKDAVADPEILNQLTDRESEPYKDLQCSIETIASRSQGLMEFIDSYRSLSSLPEPTFTKIPLETLFRRIGTLLNEKMNDAQIDFTTSIENHQMTVNADVKLLEQILINLLSNAIDAVDQSISPSIQLLSSSHRNGKTLIQVRDNGCGISKQVIDNIFTPFFTTKTQGSGIGLSLSRQLARINRSSLSVSSLEGSGSTFTLTF
ncbi:MAG: ATP-binding protein [SAR86 cluster bacterium]|uniref:histidine kinase n=1 Tax=SAR86 cluster bacterium TaxID=2030880 RepID=A0A2A4MG50_9GAMM|nr:MAG: ATP-binding protein [SAR86 cluster bacterium]